MTKKEIALWKEYKKCIGEENKEIGKEYIIMLNKIKSPGQIEEELFENEKREYEKMSKFKKFLIEKPKKSKLSFYYYDFLMTKKLEVLKMWTSSLKTYSVEGFMDWLSERE